MTKSHLIIGEVVSLSKELEKLLKNQFYAKGKGLHELISSIQIELENKNIDVKKLRKIASIRNSVVHDPNCIIDIVYFKKITNESITELNNIQILKNKEKFIYTKEEEIESLEKKENKSRFIIFLILLISAFIIYNIFFSTNYTKLEEKLKSINTEISYLENKINETNILIKEEELKHNFFSKTFNKSEKLKELEETFEENSHQLDNYIEEREKLKNILIKKP